MKTKRIFACLTIVVLLAVSLPLASLAETYATVISWDVLHLRSGPGSDYAVIGKYRRGTKVEVLSTSYRNWVRVRTPDKKTGYMYKQYLSSFTTTGSSSSSSSKSSSSNSSSGGIGTGFRYVESGIGPVNSCNNSAVDSTRLDQLPGGTLVSVLSSGATWSKVRYNGTVGYIKTRYLTKTRK